MGTAVALSEGRLAVEAAALIGAVVSAASADVAETRGAECTLKNSQRTLKNTQTKHLTNAERNTETNYECRVPRVASCPEVLRHHTSTPHACSRPKGTLANNI